LDHNPLETDLGEHAKFRVFLLPLDVPAGQADPSCFRG
jgi:hypothetical protein